MRTPWIDFFAEFGQGGDVDFDVEVARVGDDGAVFHNAEVLGADDVFVAGEGDEEVADSGGLLHRHNVEAIHRGLDCLDGVDFGNDDDGAHTFCPHSEAPAAPAIAGDDDFAARH